MYPVPKDAALYVGRTGSVLELCCGPGVFASRLVKGSNLRYVGVDVNEELIEQARFLFRVLGLNGTFVVGDATALDVVDESFEQVWLFNWWVTSDNRKVISEVQRVLRPGGLLVYNVRTGGEFYRWTKPCDIKSC